MRNVIWVFIVCATLCFGCEVVEITSSRTRNDCRRGRTSATGKTPKQTEEGPDTSIYIAAVGFPDSYDWQRDTAYGATEYEIILYKDFKPVLKIPACDYTSPDPDMTHLVGGHLYTERSDASTTRIGRDGKELFAFEGREYLIGILPDGEEIYTLSQSRGGVGFSLRKNGKIIVSRLDGEVFGSLTEPSYAPNGALYRDEGRICFCYKSGRSTYVVRDGKDERLPGQSYGTVGDVRQIHGNVYSAGPTFFGLGVAEGRLWPTVAGFALTGLITPHYSTTKYYGYFDEPLTDGARLVSYAEVTIYYSPSVIEGVAEGPDGIVTIYRSGGKRAAGSVPCHLLTPACCAYRGQELVLALTPADKEIHPRAIVGDKTQEMDLYGFLCCTEVVISPPS